MQLPATIVSFVSLVGLSTMIPVASANFDLYEMTETVTGDGQPYFVWQVYENEPDCGDVFNTPIVFSNEDVSGDNTGVRCNGSGCIGTNDPASITLLEMNFHDVNPTLHWSRSILILVSSLFPLLPTSSDLASFRTSRA